MEWYRVVFRMADLPPCQFFDQINQLREQGYHPAGSAAWVGRAYPTPTIMHVWLCFDPGLPAHLQMFVASWQFVATTFPDELEAPISWNALFEIPLREPRERQASARPSELRTS